ncbi:MAG: cytochrome P450 [Candidatus Binatia bacterium]
MKDLNIMDPELYVNDPHSTYKWLRNNAPVFWDENNSTWVISKYEDVVEVSTNPKVFHSSRGILPDTDAYPQISIVTMDDPRHGQLRRLVNRGFTPSMVELLEDRVRAIVNESIDAVIERGRCDFAVDIAAPLPLLVIAELLGIRRGDEERFKLWSDAMMLSAGRSTEPHILERATEAFSEYAAYLRDLIEERRRKPEKDLISVLIGAYDEGVLESSGDVMEENELLMFMTLLMVAGNETTRNAIAGGVLALIQNPDQRRKLIDDLGLLDSATEEVIRWVSPIIGFARTATEDTAIRGQRIAKDDKVFMLYQSANRDEEVFEEADRFRIDRSPNDHLAFGIGSHYCLGANLARLEIKIMLESLTRRMPDIELAPGAGVTRFYSPIVAGIESMPVVFSHESVEN